MLVKTPENADPLAAVVPFTKDYPIPDGGARYYLCRDGTCVRPVDRVSKLEALWEQI